MKMPETVHHGEGNARGNLEPDTYIITLYHHPDIWTSSEPPEAYSFTVYGRKFGQHRWDVQGIYVNRPQPPDVPSARTNSTKSLRLLMAQLRKALERLTARDLTYFTSADIGWDTAPKTP